MPISEIHNTDCMDFMATIPDKFFDLAVVDPPYGIMDLTGRDAFSGGGKLKNRLFNRAADSVLKWDLPPTKEYFDELFRISKNQIIWGYNYFPLPRVRGYIVWDKVQPWDNFSQTELAWTSFDGPAALFRYDNRTGDKTHPTQKPVALYHWLLKKYANPGDKIFDSHLGSGSSRIAAYKMGFDFWGCEIDKQYFDASQVRFEQECLNSTRLPDGQKIVQQKLGMFN